MKQFWKVDSIDMEFLWNYFRKEKNVSMLKYIMKDEYDVTYIDDNAEKKTNIIKNIVNVLGFDLKNIDLKLDIKTFMENTNRLLTNSEFSKNHDKIRILFDKSKKSTNTTMKCTYLVPHLNSYLSECCLFVHVIQNRVYNKCNKKQETDSSYQLCIQEEFGRYI